MTLAFDKKNGVKNPVQVKGAPRKIQVKFGELICKPKLQAQAIAKGHTGKARWAESSA